jgi:hypothetical protein
MKRCLFLCLIILCLVASGAAWSTPLNEFNEIQNGDFETGVLAPWQAGADILVAKDGPGHHWAATCKSSGVDVWLRQIVDDSLNPYWNPNYHAKRIDLVADVTWSGLVETSSSGISFRLDWWDDSYNGVEDPTVLPHYWGTPPTTSDPANGYNVSDWVTYTFADMGILPGQWATVNPFDRYSLPTTQPRWVSVEVSYVQADGEAVWMDNVVLTANCVPGEPPVPEPSGVLIMLTGIVPLAWSRRYLKRK